MLDTAGNVLNQIMADNWLHLHLPEEGKKKNFRVSFKSLRDISNPQRVCLIVVPEQIISVFIMKAQKTCILKHFLPSFICESGSFVLLLLQTVRPERAPVQIKSGYHIIKEEKVPCPDYIRGVLAVWFLRFWHFSLCNEQMLLRPRHECASEVRQTRHSQSGLALAIQANTWSRERGPAKAKASSQAVEPASKSLRASSEGATLN